MADWYVDLSASTNGDGSTSSPWNDFTSTENASVNAGDRVWFRRTDTGEYISGFKEGDVNNPIYYIGWPKEGDDFYSIRDSGLAATWDLDSEDYCYLKRSIANNSNEGVMVLKSNSEYHRFRAYNTYPGCSNYTCSIRINSQSNISIKYGYFQMYLTCYNYGTNRSLYATSSNNIKFYECKFYYNAYSSYRYEACFCYINSCNIVFDSCTIYNRYDNSTVVYSMDGTTESNYINSSTATFTDCTFVWGDRTSNDNHYGFYLAHEIYISSSNVTISGCDLYNDRAIGSYTLPGRCFISYFDVYNCNVSVIDQTIDIDQKMTSFMCIRADCNVSVNNIEWNCSYAPNTLFLLYCWDDSLNSLNINSVYGNVTQPGGSINDYNYLFTVYGDDLYYSDKIQITNCAFSNPYSLDIARTSYDIDVDNLPANTISTVCTTALTKVNSVKFINSSKINSIMLLDLSANSSYFVYGGLGQPVTIDLYNNHFNNIPVKLDNTFNQVLYVTIDMCRGNSTAIVEYSGGNSFGGEIKAIRNIGFSSIGYIGNHKSFTTYSTFNNYDNGTTQLTKYHTQYQTSSIKRDGGAGYSVELHYRNTVNDELIQYPIKGYDTTWIYLAASGTYTVNAYVSYISESTTGFNEGDIYTNIIAMNETPEEYKTSTLTTDNSTWVGLPSTASGIKLTNSVHVTSAQYCPVILNLEKYLDGVKVYFDPKLEVLNG